MAHLFPEVDRSGIVVIVVARWLERGNITVASSHGIVRGDPSLRIGWPVCRCGRAI